MNIEVDTISAGGRQVRFDLGDGWAVRAAVTALEAEPSRLDGSLLLLVNERVLSVTGALSVAATSACARCTAEVELALEPQVELTYRARAREVDIGDEVELSAADLDDGWYEDGRISIEDVLSEAIALALPPRVLCAAPEACEHRTRALFPADSEDRSGHPAFQALAHLKSP